MLHPPLFHPNTPSLASVIFVPGAVEETASTASVLFKSLKHHQKHVQKELIRCI